jgi:hypothetical protein
MGSADQTRHRSLASLDQYIRMESAWTDNPATPVDRRKAAHRIAVERLEKHGWGGWCRRNSRSQS